MNKPVFTLPLEYHGNYHWVYPISEKHLKRFHKRYLNGYSLNKFSELVTNSYNRFQLTEKETFEQVAKEMKYKRDFEKFLK